MKTTVEIDDDPPRAAKRAALDEDTSLRAIVERALRRELDASPKTEGEVKPPRFAGGRHQASRSGSRPRRLNMA